jgi:hypothetical protein
MGNPVHTSRANGKGGQVTAAALNRRDATRGLREGKPPLSLERGSQEGVVAGTARGRGCDLPIARLLSASWHDLKRVVEGATALFLTYAPEDPQADRRRGLADSFCGHLLRCTPGGAPSNRCLLVGRGGHARTCVSIGP